MCFFHAHFVSFINLFRKMSKSFSSFCLRIAPIPKKNNNIRLKFRSVKFRFYSPTKNLRIRKMKKLEWHFFFFFLLVLVFRSIFTKFRNACTPTRKLYLHSRIFSFCKIQNAHNFHNKWIKSSLWLPLNASRITEMSVTVIGFRILSI